jgi:hypothetical protein
MIHYITYDDTGAIVSGGVCTEQNLALVAQSLEGLSLLRLDAPIDDFNQWRVEGGQLVESTATASSNYQYDRYKAYDLGEQLGLLYKDIDAGLFGTKAKTSGFFAYVKSIKEQFPKP